MSTSKSSRPPLYLTATSMEKRKKFLQVTTLGDRRIEDALAAPSSSPWSVNHALKKTNMHKNRYSNVFPWDKTRVVLPVTRTFNGSNPSQTSGNDYINASYVDIDPQCKYIAAQGPLQQTSHHFWAMAYHESEKQNNDTVIIAMVTPLMESGMIKCFQYWPDTATRSFDFSRDIRDDQLDIPGSKLVVKYVKESYNALGDYLLTELTLQSATKTKKVYHYYYFKWADARVPPSLHPLLALSKDIRSLSHSVVAQSKGSDPSTTSQPPVPIIHCSAGVGRTGTFIAIDYLFRDNMETIARAHEGDHDPIFDIVSRLRDCRMMMVQTMYQFNFLYESVEQFYTGQLE